ncbi:unnamed protein product [Staurois parvus]|uniref:Uncharacterized protein n=1 Tax=Staurois parvus TaxID=386267 RepID=A0ABN9GSW5_9NEOB|nr:unnamed protein product [Staurois parvus]
MLNPQVRSILRGSSACFTIYLFVERVRCHPVRTQPAHLPRDAPALHSLYLVSPDAAFTISGLPQYREHGNAVILVNKNC